MFADLFTTLLPYGASVVELVLLLTLLYFGFAIRALVMRVREPKEAGAAYTDFDPTHLQAALDHDSLKFRHQARQYLREHADVFRRRPEEYDFTMQQQRAAAEVRTRKYVDSKLMSVRDITADTLKFIAAHEIFCICDPSAIYFFSVHFNLFGGTVLRLGSDGHREQFLDDIDSFDARGCFALTEFRHGVNSGFFMDTTAHFDATTEEFIIHTPDSGAQKHWISFAADRARVAIVFAQLHIGDECHGVHAFMVDIRDDTGSVREGVRIEDVGHKPCLNGNDNGRLFFHHVRVPRSALLDRFSQVDADGSFHCAIEKIRDRFLSVSDQLMSGRMCIGASAVVLSKLALLCAIRYSVGRTQAQWDKRLKKPTYDNTLWDKMCQRRCLVQALAGTVASSFMINFVKERYAKRSPSDMDEVTALVCGAKSYTTLEAVRISGMCRDKCGGQGLISVNQLGELVNVAASIVVVEGDSMLLAQKCAKFVLDKMQDKGKAAMLALGALESLKYNARLAMFAVKPGDVEGLLFVLNARVHFVAFSLALSLANYHRKGVGVLEAWSKHLLPTVLDLHNAYMDALSMQRSLIALKSISHEPTQLMLKRLVELFALSRVESNLGWFYSSTYLSSFAGKSVTARIDNICTAIDGPCVVRLLKAFAFPEELLEAIPIASDWEKVME